MATDKLYTRQDIVDAYLDGFYEGNDDMWYADHSGNNPLPDIGSTGDKHLQSYLRDLCMQKQLNKLPTKKAI